jgi:quercetin dioxygenase-like cupin family protein
MFNSNHIKIDLITRDAKGENHMSIVKNPTTGMILDLFGPTVEFLTSPQDTQNDFCVLRGTIPSGVFVPLHSHPDTEDFLVISGEVEGLRQDSEDHIWIRAKVGDYIHVPSNVRHAWRNISGAPTVDLIITTKKLGHFFLETGRPVTGSPLSVTSEDLVHFAAVSSRYGYWNATPEENAAVGIHMSF